MKKELILEKLSTLIDNLKSLVKQECINKISNNLLFLIDCIDDNNLGIVRDQKYIAELMNNNYISLNQIVEILYSKQNIVSWVDLTIVYTDDMKTIILATIIENNKSVEEIDFHASLQLPKEYDEREKFDLNKLFKY